MEKLEEKLSLSFNADLRNQLIANFHILNCTLAWFSQQAIQKEITEAIGEYGQTLNKQLQQSNEKLERQIQAIIDPRYNDVALEIQEARRDSRGVVHPTINDRINAEINRLEAK